MKVSIIIDTKNSALSIVDTIKNVIDQDLKFFYEMVIVDNNSTDSTIIIIEEFKKIFENIKLIKNKKDISFNEIRNIGLNNAEGEYICFLDSNVVWEHNKLSVQVEALERCNKSSLCFSNFKLINDIEKTKVNHFNNYPFFKKMIIPKKDFQVCKNIFNVIIKENLIDIYNILIRRDSLVEIGGFNNKFGTTEDWDLWLKLASKSSFVFCNKILMDKNILINNIDLKETVLLNVLRHYKQYCNSRTYKIAKSNCYADIAENLIFKNKKKEGLRYYLKSLRTSFQIKNFKSFCYRLSLY